MVLLGHHPHGEARDGEIPRVGARLGEVLLGGGQVAGLLTLERGDAPAPFEVAPGQVLLEEQLVLPEAQLRVLGVGAQIEIESKF